MGRALAKPIDHNTTIDPPSPFNHHIKINPASPITPNIRHHPIPRPINQILPHRDGPMKR